MYSLDLYPLPGKASDAKIIGAYPLTFPVIYNIILDCTMPLDIIAQVCLSSSLSFRLGFLSY
jgi:hypothetical protein